MQAPSKLESYAIRVAAMVLSPAGRRGSLATLIFHRVLPQPDPLLPDEPDAATFTVLVNFLADNFNVLPLTDAVARLRTRSLPPRAISITFDDGYANNHDIALPILASRNLPATVFVATGFLNGGIMFNDIVIESVRQSTESLDLRELELGEYRLSDKNSRISAISEILSSLKYLTPEVRLRRAMEIGERARATMPRDLMMTDAQVTNMQKAGIEIGAHTVSHPILTRIPQDAARREIRDSKRILEDITGGPIRSFAYPNGRPILDYNRKHVAAVREAGFDLAVSTAWGTATGSGDNCQLPRVPVWVASLRRSAASILKGYVARKPAVV